MLDLENAVSCSFDYYVSFLFFLRLVISMKITWATRSFLDYRVPVYQELNRLVDNKLTVIYYGDVVPERTRSKVTNVLGRNAITLSGELRLTGEKMADGPMANTGIRILYQPGLIKAICRSEPDVLISDGFFQWTYSALWLRALKKIPHVMCYERTSHTERNAQWYRVTYRKFVMRWIDAICCNGKLCGEYVQSLGYPAEKVTYGHMVADIAGLENSATKVTDKQVSELRTKHDLRETVFLYVGQLIPRKGLVELLNAWKKFSSGIFANEATLLLVGDGPQRDELEQYIKENCLDNVRLAGFVDYDSLAPYYKAADAFIIPTLEDNWSLVVPEAMACGLPILCSKYNGCWPELVTSENGWVFDALDSNDMVGCLNKCLLVKEKLPEMGRKSCQIVNNNTAKHAAEAILNACEIAMHHICKS